MTKIQTFKKAWLVAIASVAPMVTMLPASLAVAQESADNLDEIVVTAQRRQVDIQSAAIAVSVTSGEDLDRSNIRSLDDFNGYVPGLTVTKNDGAGRVVSIRGVGWETAQNLSTQPSVLLYIDGVYIANPISMGSILNDLERVEVFRGPQGTEFGQGATGGAINLVTKRPHFDAFGGDIDVGFGTFNSIRAAGSLNMPLSDNAAIRASLQSYTRDGFAEIEGGALDDDADSLSGRLSLLWEPNEDWSVYVSALLQDSDQHAAAQKNVDDPNRDARELTQDFPGIFELQNNVFSAIIEWKSPSGVVFKSITGYQDMEKRQSVDGDRLNEALTSIDILGFFVTTANWDVLTFWDNDSEAFSQELNVSYVGESVDWTVGGYYLDHENFNHFLEANGPAPFSDSIDALANPGPDTLPPFQSVLNFVEARTVSREDWAAYGQVRFHLNDRVSVLAGGRYQEEDQRDEAVQFFFIPSSQKLSDDEFTWKLGVDFKVTDDNLLYALISTGWKNGGTNPGALNGAIDVPVVFQPAEVTSYEIGSKNMFDDGRFRLNVVGFYNDYENMQFMQEDPVPFAGGTGNIPDTEIYGVETEFGWAITDGWRMDGHVTWLDGEINSDLFTLDVVDFREALAPGVGLFTEQGLL